MIGKHPFFSPPKTSLSYLEDSKFPVWCEKDKRIFGEFQPFHKYRFGQDSESQIRVMLGKDKYRIFQEAYYSCVFGFIMGLSIH